MRRAMQEEIQRKRAREWRWDWLLTQNSVVRQWNHALIGEHSSEEVQVKWRSPRLDGATVEVFTNCFQNKIPPTHSNSPFTFFLPSSYLWSSSLVCLLLLFVFSSYAFSLMPLRDSPLAAYSVASARTELEYEEKKNEAKIVLVLFVSWMWGKYFVSSKDIWKGCPEHIMVSEEQMALRAKLNLSHINEHNGYWRGHTLMTHKQKQSLWFFQEWVGHLTKTEDTAIGYISFLALNHFLQKVLHQHRFWTEKA